MFGAGAHTDYGMLTILATDHVPGLQLRDRGSHEWMDVPPAPGLFIINLGDMLERLVPLHGSCSLGAGGICACPMSAKFTLLFHCNLHK